MAHPKTTQILTAVTANSNGAAIQAAGPFSTIFIGGTFDTCNVDAELSPDGITWFPVRGATPWTEAGCDNLDVSEGVWLRLVVSSVGGSTSINAWIN